MMGPLAGPRRRALGDQCPIVVPTVVKASGPAQWGSCNDASLLILSRPTSGPSPHSLEWLGGKGS